MRVLLIGGSGFIGPHVARALEHLGREVVVFHRRCRYAVQRRALSASALSAVHSFISSLKRS
jgi:nucleoside-diphosphate-sugar epimerase